MFKTVQEPKGPGTRSVFHMTLFCTVECRFCVDVSWNDFPEGSKAIFSKTIVVEFVVGKIVGEARYLDGLATSTVGTQHIWMDAKHRGIFYGFI